MKKTKQSYSIKLRTSCVYSYKIWLEGRVFKLKTNLLVFNFRFNRFNKTYFIRKTLLNLKEHGLRRKIYLHNLLSKQTKKKLAFDLFRIRKYNTYTLRGISVSWKVRIKRQGRVSEYF